MKIRILASARRDLIEGYRRFPFPIYYRVEGQTVLVYAGLDCRRDPAWIRKRLG